MRIHVHTAQDTDMRDCGTAGLLSDVDTVELLDFLAEGRPTSNHLWPSQQA